jgi:LacI family transcriptional regulator
MKTRKVTLSSIADDLNVSKTLVSLVLNGKADALSINKETQKRVIARANELNYKPNQVARGLRMGQTHTLGLLVADISNPFYARITRTIEHIAESEGYSLIVCSSDESENREKHLVKMLLDRQVDGIIMTTTIHQPEVLKDIIPPYFPLVLFDRYLTGFESQYVGVDNEQATHKAVKHLLDLGHRNIGFLTLTPNYISTLNDRQLGYLNAFKAYNFPVNDKYLLQLDYVRLKNKDYNQITQFLTENPEITALFTANNNLAVACLKTTKELGKQIPEDFSLITFDDVECFSYTAPAISCIAQPLEKIGEVAVKMALQQIKNKRTEPQKVILQTELIYRNSTCAIN